MTSERKPTIPSSTFSAFIDLPPRLDHVRIEHGDNRSQRHIVGFAPYEVGAHINLYFSEGSLEVLRDAINAHLDEDTS